MRCQITGYTITESQTQITLRYGSGETQLVIPNANITSREALFEEIKVRFLQYTEQIQSVVGIVQGVKNEFMEIPDREPSS